MPPSQLPSEEDFLLWKANPVTRRLMGFLAKGIEATKDDFVKSRLMITDQWLSGMTQANAIGRCEMAQTIIDIDYQQLEKFDEE